MDCYLVIFVIIIILSHIYLKHKDRFKVLEGNENKLETVKFSNNSQRIINDIIAKQKEMNVLLKMGYSEESNEKKEELFDEINEKIELWMNDNDDKKENSEIELQRRLMFSIFTNIKKQNERLFEIYITNKDKIDDDSDKVGDDDVEGDDVGDDDVEGDDVGDDDVEGKKEEKKKKKKIKEQDTQAEEEKVSIDDVEYTSYEDVPIYEEDISIKDQFKNTMTGFYQSEDRYIIFVSFLFVTTIVVLLFSTIKGERNYIYRTYLKRYINKIKAFFN